MTWFILTIIAYALLAGVALGDKFFLSGPTQDPKVYAFYVGLLGGLTIFAAPFLGFPVPENGPLVIMISAGAFFVLGQFLLFRGLSRYEASRIVPAIGALIPVFTLVLSGFVFGFEDLSLELYISFALLIVGSVVMTWQGGKVLSGSIFLAALSSLIFGASFVASKVAYTYAPFWDGFLWMRLGGVIFALTFLISPSARKTIFGSLMSRKKTTHGNLRLTALFLLNQACGAAAVVLQNIAVFMVPTAYVAFINALQGVEYVFILIFALMLVPFFPSLKKTEIISKTSLIQKALGVIIVGAGLYLFALHGGAV